MKFLSYSQCGETQFYGLPFEAVPDLIDSDSDGHLIISLGMNNNSTILVMDHARNIINQKSLGGSNAKIRDIAIDENDNLYICGSFSSSVNIGAGFVFNATGVSESIFVAKLNHNLQAIWAHVSTGSSSSNANGNDRGHSITVDSLGGVYFSIYQDGSFTFQGQTYSIPTSDKRMIVSKLNPNDGLIEWENYQETNSENRYPMLKASQLGGVYEVINFTGNFTDDQGEYFQTGGTAVDWSNTLIMFYNSLGVHQWSKHITGGGNMKASDVDENGHLLLYGNIGDTMTVDSDTIFNLYKSSMYYLEIDTSGNVHEMERIITSDKLNYFNPGTCALDYIGNGQFLVSGTTKLEMNFNGIVQPNLDNVELTSFAALYDSTFTPVWARTFGVGQYVYNAGIEEMNGCSAYYMGHSFDHFYFEDTDSIISIFNFIPLLIEFDIETGLLSTQGSGTGSSNDPFGPNGVQGSDASISELSEAKFSIYPNPVLSQLNIQFETPKDYDWQLINSYGQVIMKGKGQNSTIIDMIDLSSGLYLVTIQDCENTLTKKIVKQ